jgi:FkbM family methyltransferase
MLSWSAFIDAFLKRVSHHYATLPYNLNWGVDTAPIRAFLSENPLCVVDVGAHGGPMGELEGLSRFVSYAGFDADREECRRLQAAAPSGYAAFRIYPYFIGPAGTVDFHVYARAGLSSSYRISDEYNAAFIDTPFEAQRVVPIQALPLDEAMEREGLRPPDLLKLDTQGSELAILSGSVRTLSETPLVEAEVEFFPMYDGQPLFADVDAFMRAHGFQLLYLNRAFQQRRKFYKGQSRGQLVFGDALFGKAPSALSGLSPERIAKYVILLAHYGHVDLACQVYSEHPEIRTLCPGLSHCFRPAPSLLRRGLACQFDKVICLMLHARRTNHLMGDSDRSWPIR